MYKLHICTALILALFVSIPNESYSFDIDPRTVTGVEGETVVFEFFVDADDWEFNTLNCPEETWGIDLSSELADGSAQWGKDLEEATPSCIWTTATPPFPPVSSALLGIELYTDNETEDQEDAFLFVQYCPDAGPQKISQTEDGHCQEIMLTIYIEDSGSPDLEVSQVRVFTQETTLEVDENFAPLATVKNVGDGPADDGVIRFYLSEDEIIDRFEDFEIGYSLLPEQGVLPGYFVDVYDPEATASVAPGTYYLGACLQGVTGDTNQENDCDTGPLITVVPGECNSTQISCGESLSERLSLSSCTTGPLGSETFAELYKYYGEKGDRLFLEAEWTFDGYLLLENPGGVIVAENDNYTDSGNSRIEYELNEAGAFNIWASSYAPETTGSFELSLACNSPGGPDLEPELPTISSTQPDTGQALVVSTRIWNRGNQPTDSTSVRYYLSSDDVIDENDAELESDGVPGLGLGQNAFAQVNLVAPGTPGPYWIGVCTDAVSGEQVLTNNCSEGRKISVSKPPSCGISSVSCGAFIAGNLNSADCTSGPRGPGFLTEEFRISTQAGVPLRVTSQWMGMDGYLYLVDPDGVVVKENDDDLNSGNNQSLIDFVPSRSGTYTVWPTTYSRGEQGNFDLSVECGTAAAPDLVASATVIGGKDVSVGDQLTIRYTITNQGNAAADGTRILMCLSDDSVISLRDSLLQDDDIASLAAGQSTTVDMVVEVPDQPGDYWVGPCAVAVEGETVTSNNCVSAVSQSQPQAIGRSGPAQLQNDQGGGSLIQVSSGAACEASALSCGAGTNGGLTADDCDRGPRGSGYLTDAYSFTGGAGDAVTLDVAWTGLDGYLYLTDTDGVIVGENDDFPDASASRVEVELPAAGTYTVWASAFDQGSGDNATGSYALTLGCNNPQAPDLAVSTPDLSATQVRPGQSLAIEARVSNGGDGSAAASKLRYYLSSAPQVAATDRQLGSSDIEALAAGASSKQELTVPLNVTPGSYYVAACADADPLELEWSNNCASSGPVTVEENLEPIAINLGLNDAWYNPVTDGQGFFINVFPDTRTMFLSWFTYDTERPPSSVDANLGDPGARWLTAQGTYERGVADLSVTLTEGGTFDSPTPMVMNTPDYGSMVVSFSDCNTGQVEYDLPAIGDSGSIPITRVANDNVVLCEELIGAASDSSAQQLAQLESGSTLLKSKPPVHTLHTETESASGFSYSPLLNDAWFNPETNGQGFFFNVFPDKGVVFLSWFTYDTERPPGNTPYNLGEPGHRWLTAQGPYAGDTADLSVTMTEGGVFNQASPKPQNTPDGTIEASFENCNKGTVKYTINSIGESGEVPIERITRDSIPACEQVAREDQATEAAAPQDKQVLENACNGPVTWDFDWPEGETDTYQFCLKRNDTLQGTCYFEKIVDSSDYRYRKDTPVPDAHLAGWQWSYAPIDPALLDGDKTDILKLIKQLIEGRKAPTSGFTVKPQSDPCLE